MVRTQGHLSAMLAWNFWAWGNFLDWAHNSVQKYDVLSNISQATHLLVQFTSGHIESRVPCPYTMHGAQCLRARSKGCCGGGCGRGGRCSLQYTCTLWKNVCLEIRGGGGVFAVDWHLSHTLCSMIQNVLMLSSFDLLFCCRMATFHFGMLFVMANLIFANFSWIMVPMWTLLIR